ncbi:MAG: T9SS type A sorting domain-containing protein [Saprospiraceae bacterium]|nr:T9SS type A sorting domain-containing protein [Saprospiraceae bacterium]MCB0622640.1 T9SS type A sorting domain-containing protein [Saprospiraceae bacterium]MCB0678710.1 T9SS type A sorting domain-containing protein [Saprospiraceae bacterium]MCB0682754.1 T9SS type A sorting domain-containing protein [Saprospiraceae bacterium]
MKLAHFTLVILTLCTYQTGAAQTYVPLVEEGKKWSVWFCSAEGTSECVHYAINLFEISGDTTIANTNYKKLLHRRHSDPVFNYLGGLREDSLKRVYYLGQQIPNYHYCFDQNYEEELLLYDFGLEEGDSIQFSTPLPSYFYKVHVDTIEIGGHFRRRITFESHFFEWIEGIGDIHWLFMPLCYCHEHCWSLVCFSGKDLSLDYSGNISGVKDCETVDVGERRRTPARLFPNPFAEVLSIELEETDLWQVAIYDLLGRQIYSRQEFTQSLTISAENLPEGIYLVVVRSADGQVREVAKVLKTSRP